MKTCLSATLVSASLVLLTNTWAHAQAYVSTDRCSYTGALTKYATLEDALAGTNAIGGPYSIPDRATASPYDTGYRDLGIAAIKDVVGETDANIFVTAWSYTTNPDHGEDSGWGNPNNTNTGFLQLYDADGSTETSFFGAFNSSLTEYTLQIAGANAFYDSADPSNDYARLWHAPGIGGAGALTGGSFLQYEFEAVFGGLSGAWDADAGMYVADTHPTSVSGTFRGIFLNDNTVDTQYNGYYVIDYTLGMDNWAYAQETLNGVFSPSSFGSVVPEPGTLGLLVAAGIAGLIAQRIRRQKPRT